MPKRDLTFRKPVMNAAGSLGLAPRIRPAGHSSLEEFGAFVTNPISLRPRTAAAQPVVIEFPGGFLLHTGLANPGFEAVLRKFAQRWADSPVPVIVHLMADRAEETKQMIRQLEGLENVMAAELGFAPLLADDILLLTLELSRAEMPLIFSLPGEQVLTAGPKLMQNGAAAISLAARRGAGVWDGKLISGRLFGPALFPEALETVYTAARLGLPVIGGGGVYSEKDEQAMLSAGALAVQRDASLWLPENKKNPVA